MVCPLTGIVVGTVYPVIMDPGQVSSLGQINCVLSTTVRRTKTVSRRDNSAVRRFVVEALKQVFWSKDRKELNEKKKERLCRFIRREARRGKSHAEITALLMTRELPCLGCDLKHQRDMLRRLVSPIVDHWSKFNMRPLRKIVFAFVGAVLTLLRTGKKIDNIELFQVHQGLLYYHPDEADLGPLLSISCRNITKMMKVIVEESLQRGGIPKPGYSFAREISP